MQGKMIRFCYGHCIIQPFSSEFAAPASKQGLLVSSDPLWDGMLRFACDPDKIDRQECHTEYPAETGNESNRGEPHLSDHDGGTDRTENNV